MTSGRSRASRPTGATNGVIQVIDTATTQVATTTMAAASACRPRAASAMAAPTRTPAAASTPMVRMIVVDSPVTVRRRTTRASTETQIAMPLTRR